MRLPTQQHGDAAEERADADQVDGQANRRAARRAGPRTGRRSRRRRWPAHAGQPICRKYSDRVEPRPEGLAGPRAHEAGDDRLAGGDRVAHELGVEDGLEEHRDQRHPQQRQPVSDEGGGPEQELAAADRHAEHDDAGPAHAYPRQAARHRRLGQIGLLPRRQTLVMRFTPPAPEHTLCAHDRIPAAHADLRRLHRRPAAVARPCSGGEVFGFLGPNGAGKTTTIRMMMGILVPSGGRALINGLDCHAQRAEVQRHVGYLPDNPIYYDFLRGREILQFVAEMHGMGRARGRAARAAHARGVRPRRGGGRVRGQLFHGHEEEARPRLRADPRPAGADPRRAHQRARSARRARGAGSPAGRRRRPARPSSCPRTCSTWRRRSARASASSIAASSWPPARWPSCASASIENASLEEVFLKVTDEDAAQAPRREPGSRSHRRGAAAAQHVRC